MSLTFTQGMTAETAPTDRPILVWVRDKAVASDKPNGWRMGRCSGYGSLPKKLYADGFNGDWDIPYWHPLPSNPE